MQHRVTSAAPVSSSRCGYRARVSLKAACIFASFVLLPLPVSVVCVCVGVVVTVRRCCCPTRSTAASIRGGLFFFSSSSRVCQGHAALLRVVSVAKLTSVSHFQLLPSCLVYLRARFPACPAPPAARLMRVSCVFCVCATVKPLHEGKLSGAIYDKCQAACVCLCCWMRFLFISADSGFNINFFFMFYLSRHQFGSRVRWQREVGR